MGSYDVFQANIQSYFASIDEALATKDSNYNQLVSANQALQASNALNEAKILELQAQIEALTTPPVVRKTYFGACPAAGGSSLIAAESVITKWGIGSAIRQFFSGGFTANPNHPADSTLVHTSYKPDNASVVNGSLDSAIAELVQSMTDGDILEIWHEADLKVRKGSLDKATVVSAKNHFYDIVKSVNPRVLVATTYTGWLFEPKSGLDASEWSSVKADLLGVDLDGIAVDTPPYPDWSDEVPAVVEWAEKWGYSGWCVPEFGAVRAPSGDTNGEFRAAWAESWAQQFIAKNAHYVAYFDYRGMNYEMDKDAEIASWKKFITT